jgi:hypothetical protein
LPAIRHAFLVNPDMIVLARTKDPNWTRRELVEAMTAELLAEGFQDAGVFSVDKMPGVLVRLMIGPEQDATAAIYDHPKVGAWADITSIYDDGQIITATTMPDTGMPRPEWLKFFRFEGASAAQLYQRLLKARPAGQLRMIASDEAPRQFERTYFQHSTWLKQRDLSLDDLQKLVDNRIKDAGKAPYLTAKKSQKRHERRQKWAAAICLPLAGLLLVAAYFVLTLAWDAYCLQTRGEVINAAATDFQILSPRRHRQYRQVHYSFQLGEGGPLYSRRGPWGANNAWASIKYAAYDEAQKSRLVAVRYDRANPWTNELVEAPGLGAVTRSPWFFVFGALPFILVGLFTLALGFSALMLTLIE